MLPVVAVLVGVCSACATKPPVVRMYADIPGMLIISGGRFTMGRDKGELNERPAHKVVLEEFAIDRTEVSARDFAEFLNAAGNEGEHYLTPDDHATVVIAQLDDAARDVHFKPRAGYENFPANNVSWDGADAYCRWVGKRLPTEAEWEKASRGTDKRLFPWGKRSPLAERARFGQSWTEKQFNVLFPVDALPAGASPYGALNMSGNVLEWVGDWYRQNLCDFCDPGGESNLRLVRQLTGQEDVFSNLLSPTETAPTERDGADISGRKNQSPPRNNPMGPTTGSFKVLRGGSWMSHVDAELTTTHRFWLDPTQRFPTTGFRCIKDHLRNAEGTMSPDLPAGKPDARP